MSLTFRQLEVIRAVIRAGSVTDAAATLGISQPAVSMILRECTTEAGFPLFMRRQGRLQPTGEAKALFTEIDRIFDGTERVQRLVHELRNSSVGLVRIATTPTLAENLLPLAVAEFRRKRPQVQIAIQTMINYEVVDHVVEERVDFGLLLSPQEHLNTKTVDLCTSELICIAPTSHPLARRKSVGPRDLLPYPLVSFNSSLPLGALIDQAYRTTGVFRRIAVEVSQTSAAVALVKAGVGIAVVDPFWLLDERGHDLARLRFVPRTELSAQILLSRNGRLSRAARLLATTIREIAARTQGTI